MFVRDRETVQQMLENMYMQYFIGYSSFSDEVPFDPSLFVEIPNRLGPSKSMRSMKLS
jgi:transposase, IS5 family